MIEEKGSVFMYDERKVLIYHYSTKRGVWYDATRVIDDLQTDERAWKVRFANHKNYVHVPFRSLRVFRFPQRIPFGELYFRGSPCYKVKELICFEKKIYKIIHENGYTRVAFPQEIRIVKNAIQKGGLASKVMAYYRRVVEEIATTEEDMFLIREFDHISYVNEESVLALYLNGKLGEAEPLREYPRIYPFGVNLSQYKALEMMFSNRVSMVEGPPGTGKTQVILTFIANAVIHGKTVAVVSNNNSATANVYEKLTKNGYSFFAAPLGNAHNVERFFENYHQEVPSFQSKGCDVLLLKRLSRSLPTYFDLENKRKKAEERLQAITLEYRHFLRDHPSLPSIPSRSRLTKAKAETISKIMVELREQSKIPAFWTRLKIRWRFGAGKWLLKHSASDIYLILEHLYYQANIREVEKEIAGYKEELGNESFEAIVEKTATLSEAYFEHQLKTLFQEQEKKTYDKDSYLSFFSRFVKEHPVILSSTYSLARCSQKGFLFDYLIVDESSQVNMASAILSMRMARNIVVVGDSKQLPQIDESSFAKRNEELLKQFGIPKTYSYHGNSLLSSMTSLYGMDLPRVTLSEHYRCDPEIISFCNERFYDDGLVIYSKSKSTVFPMKVIKTVPGNFARKNPNGTGWYNQREVDEIAELLAKENLEDVGVISPYRCQAELLAERLGEQAEASTIHKFQGKEKKTIIFTSVVNEENEFVENENLVNVAVSRAVDRFILVTSDKIASSKSGVLSDLVNYIRYHGDEKSIEEGTVRSVYDLLYRDYEKQLLAFRKKHPSKEFDSENLTKALLNRILSNPDYASFGFRMHVPLLAFVNGRKIPLEEEERQFYSNPKSHVDFLIYHKMSRKPLLAIEVDGVYFHERIAVQRLRDRKKNAILDKAGIPLLRLKTNESKERERIEEALNAIG